MAYQTRMAGTGRSYGVLGGTVVLLRWRRSSEDELVTAMATAEVRAELGCRCGEEDGVENGK